MEILNRPDTHANALHPASDARTHLPSLGCLLAQGWIGERTPFATPLIGLQDVEVWLLLVPRHIVPRIWERAVASTVRWYNAVLLGKRSKTLTVILDERWRRG